MEGRCQCGAVRFTTPTPAPLAIYVCHCSECRHASSSAFGISAFFPDSFELIPSSPSARGGAGGGTDATAATAAASSDLDFKSSSIIGVYSRRTATGARLDSYICRMCGSRLLDRRDGDDDDDDDDEEPTVCVKGGCLVGLTREMLSSATHIWTREAVVDIPAGVVSWEGNPGEGVNPLEKKKKENEEGNLT